MNINLACDPINVGDEDVASFLNSVNKINSLVEKRKEDLQKTIKESQKQLRFLNDLKKTPGWIYTYLEKEKDLRDKLKNILTNDPKSIERDQERFK